MVPFQATEERQILKSKEAIHKLRPWGAAVVTDRITGIAIAVARNLGVAWRQMCFEASAAPTTGQPMDTDIRRH